LHLKFPRTILLESSDYQGSKNSVSYICMMPLAGFEVNNSEVNYSYPNGNEEIVTATNPLKVPQMLTEFMERFEVKGTSINSGLFGYSGYSSIKYFEDIQLKSKSEIPDMLYHFYRYVIRFDHFNNKLELIEFLFEDTDSKINEIELLITKQPFGFFNFKFFLSCLKKTSLKPFKSKL